MVAWPANRDGSAAAAGSASSSLIAPVLLLSSVVAACMILWSTYTHHGITGLIGFCPL